MFNINWDKENKLSTRLLFLLIFAWASCGFAMGLLLGVVI